MDKVTITMFDRRLMLVVVIAAMTGLGFPIAWAHDIRVTLPRRSELTPVQRLNRQGVEAVRKHQYEKAASLFYKAYLYDAADPFTLNNLGYISELQGKLDRAQKFYSLASQQGSDAIIDKSNTTQLQGRPMTYALSGLKDVPLQVNRMDVEAIQLLSQQRNLEADELLRKSLALDPKNPFTLNDLGVAEEATGDYPNALKYYDEAAATQSMEPIVVTLQRSSRGKPVSESAALNAKVLRKRIRNTDPTVARATMLTLRGVSALNQNDTETARKNFLEAYSLDPHNAFFLNNLGYLAEKRGDLESAQFYYSRALQAEDAGARVGLATRQTAEGQHLVAVARDNTAKVSGELDQYAQQQRRQTGPVELLRRDNKPVDATPATPSTSAPPQPTGAPQSNTAAPPTTPGVSSVPPQQTSNPGPSSGSKQPN